jgi:hypothetical protein
MLLWARGQKGFDFNRLSTVQLQLVQRQEAMVIAQGQIALGLIQVYRGLGGGWQIRLEAAETPFRLPTEAGEGAVSLEPVPTPAPSAPTGPE